VTSSKDKRTPVQTQQRWGRLAGVFPAQGDTELHALIVCVCVLFEDLRLEIAGISEDSLFGLDECGKDGRRLYFQRRSIATLFEFTCVLEELELLPSFQPIRARFSDIAEYHWKRALKYFGKHKQYVQRMRHHVGGHFGKQAAQLAIRSIHSDSIGSLEIAFYSWGKGGAKLFFANELAATATLRHVSGENSDSKARKLVRHSIIAYRYAVRAVDCIIATHVWNRFGK
jgi:hypothetical protein